MMVLDTQVVEGTPLETAIGSSLSPLTTEERKFPSERVVTEPNRNDADRTDLHRADGTSHALRVELGRFLLSTPPSLGSGEFFQAIQKWEGHVTQVGEDTFSARLATIVGEGPLQEAEIYIEEVAPDDRKLIEPGAVFYWSIGYLDRRSGRLRASIIRFRRLPVWTRCELENAEARADKLKGLLDVG